MMGQPLDVIPVVMAEQQSDVAIATGEPVPERPDACSSVENQLAAVIQLDMQAGGIAAIADRIDSRCGNRAAHTIESRFHIQLPCSGRNMPPDIRGRAIPLWTSKPPPATIA